MGQQQLLLLVLSVILVGIAIAVGITAFQSYARQTHIENIIADLNYLATQAHQYVSKPVAMGGGGGDFRPAVIPGTTNQVAGGPAGAMGFHIYFQSIPERWRNNSYATYEFDGAVDNVDHGGYHYHEHTWINTPHPQVIIKATSKLYQENGRPLVRYIAIRKDGKSKIGKTNFDRSPNEAIMRP